jgi:hypothetical protein
MRSRIVAACAALVAVVLVGCGPAPNPPVHLLTGPDTCYLNQVEGLLVVDAKYGTAILEEGASRPMPVAWFPGFTGRQVGSEVEVLDPGGHVAATTGQRTKLQGGYGGVNGVTVWVNCNLGRPS